MGLLVVEVQAKLGPISGSEKFRQHVFFLLYDHFQLQLERLGELFLDLFDALNPLVVSLCPQQHWLYGYSQNTLRRKSLVWARKTENKQSHNILKKIF